MGIMGQQVRWGDLTDENKLSERYRRSPAEHGLEQPQTVADSKRRFYAAYPHVIPGLYRRVVDELLVELHLLAGQAGFDADSLFAMGLTQVFDNLMQEFKPAERRDALFAAICSGAGLKADQLRKDAKQLREQLVPHGEAEIKSWIEQQGQGAPGCVEAGSAAGKPQRFPLLTPACRWPDGAAARSQRRR